MPDSTGSNPSTWVDGAVIHGGFVTWTGNTAFPWNASYPDETTMKMVRVPDPTPPPAPKQDVSIARLLEITRCHAVDRGDRVLVSPSAMVDLMDDPKREGRHIEISCPSGSVTVEMDAEVPRDTVRISRGRGPVTWVDVGWMPSSYTAWRNAAKHPDADSGIKALRAAFEACKQGQPHEPPPPPPQEPERVGEDEYEKLYRCVMEQLHEGKRACNLIRSVRSALAHRHAPWPCCSACGKQMPVKSARIRSDSEADVLLECESPKCKNLSLVTVAINPEYGKVWPVGACVPNPDFPLKELEGAGDP